MTNEFRVGLGQKFRGQQHKGCRDECSWIYFGAPHRNFINIFFEPFFHKPDEVNQSDNCVDLKDGFRSNSKEEEVDGIGADFEEGKDGGGWNGSVVRYVVLVDIILQNKSIGNGEEWGSYKYGGI